MTGQYLSERSYGWFKGHAIGVPSNSNSIESTHKHMKTDPDLTSKKSLRHFLGSVEKGLIYNWSMNYNPDGNPNVKVFSTMPTISTTDWVNAYKWNQLKKKVISLKHGGHTLCFTVAGDGDKILNKESCHKYLSDIEECSFTSFDQLIECVTSLHIIKINDIQWQLSESLCYMWL